MKCVAMRQISMVTAGAMGEDARSNQGPKKTPSSHSATPLDPGVGLMRR